MSKKFIGIFICIAVIFSVMISFTNCTPIHESGGSAVLLSLNECEENFQAFYKQNIKKMNYVGAAFTCGECHSNGGDDGPQFLDNFSIFASMAKNKSSIKEKVNDATSRVIRNATDGFSSDGWDHEGGDFFAGDPVSEDSINTALQKANDAFDACNAKNADEDTQLNDSANL